VWQALVLIHNPGAFKRLAENSNVTTFLFYKRKERIYLELQKLCRNVKHPAQNIPTKQIWRGSSLRNTCLCFNFQHSTLFTGTL
jgi:hypothetical protein